MGKHFLLLAASLCVGAATLSAQDDMYKIDLIPSANATMSGGVPTMPAATNGTNPPH